MGYSCTTLASLAHDAIVQILQRDFGVNLHNGQPTSNEWVVDGKSYFEERGRENRDGAVTGTVWGPSSNSTPEKPLVIKAGGYKINPDGEVVRWPTSTKEQRKEAYKIAQTEFANRFSRV